MAKTQSDAGFRLALLTLGAFAPCVLGGFVEWDDPDNYTQNPDFLGLGWSQVRWAFTTFLLGVYQPVSWLLLSAQSVVFGLNPAGYHLASVLFHVMNALALFGLARELIARARPDWALESPKALVVGSALGAASWAVHPLRVEPVAWASAQGYLPCAFFAIVMARCYLRAHPAEGPTRWRWWWAALGAFVLACLNKAPAAGAVVGLIVMDAYPLGRWPRQWKRALLEKAPFVLVAAATLAVAFLAKSKGEVVVPIGDFGLEQRIAQASYGGAFYLERTLVPMGLTIYYPMPTDVSLARLAYGGRALALAALALTALVLVRRFPGPLAALVTYLAILAPNSGLARVGDQIAADRYSYLSTIGFSVLVGAGLVAASRRWPRATLWLALVALGGLTALTVRLEVAWRDSLSLWTHAYERGGRDNAAVNLGLGLAKSGVGDLQGAEGHYRRSIELRPDAPLARTNLGLILINRGEWDEGTESLREAVVRKPKRADLRRTLGQALFEAGQVEEARAEFLAATKLSERFADAWMRLGLAEGALGDDQAADEALAKAAELAPEDPDVQRALGADRLRRGRFEEARGPLTAATRLAPDDVEAKSLLAWADFKTGRAPEAIAVWVEVLRWRPEHAPTRARLAKALEGRSDLTKAARFQGDQSRAWSVPAP